MTRQKDSNAAPAFSSGGSTFRNGRSGFRPRSGTRRDGAVPPSERITFAGIGMGGQGRGDLGGFLGFPQIQTLAVCDVVGGHAQLAKDMVDQRYGNRDCRKYTDFREVIARDDIDAVLIGTPDHWHAIIAIEAMKSGKDVYCEKPEVPDDRRRTAAWGDGGTTVRASLLGRQPASLG